MKKKYFLKSFILLFLFSGFISNAQVGIGTSNPLSTLHVEGTMRVTNTNNTTTTTKLTGTCSQGVMADVSVGSNLSLVNNVLSAADSDNSKYRIATVPMPTLFSNQVFDNIDLQLNGANAGVVVFRFIGSGHNFSISGLRGGTDGRHVILYNASAVNMKINHLSSSVPANTIDTIGASTSTSGVGTVELVYDGAASKWIVIAIRD
ncbi:hypothetical protein [Flavobacterium sp. GT3R68]|uniref:hypothetical protein n=1 Tax=Flavobacterium sp. GT3R68 TaxID=2594437 RepID=UPI000F88EDA2|nr:hypothetical protein [Flavobacterium sp. GT3R68]RTY93617.1 hypothetical protein EKL32_14925 [Flavobacterium sp. GSN2]TRW91662.1 hypothetical protein FNW07_07160 [Flavobacterium sp. GT3R68]